MNLALIYPMAAMVLLTFFVLVSLFRSRVRALKSGGVTAGYYKTYQEGMEPRETAQLSRHVVNLFESPVLFYAACLAGMVLQRQTAVLLVMAWLYFGLRVMHAAIHMGNNKLQPRMRVYFASWLVLLGMWATLVAGVATA